MFNTELVGSLVAKGGELDVPVVEAVADLASPVFLAQVFEMVNSFGGMPWTLRVAAVIMLLVASMKVSFARPLWDKLGKFKSLVAPLSGLVAGLLILGSSGSLTLAGAIAYMFAGAGAIILHELLDSIKGLPGLGKMYIAVIEFLQGLLKKPKK